MDKEYFYILKRPGADGFYEYQLAFADDQEEAIQKFIDRDETLDRMLRRDLNIDTEPTVLQILNYMEPRGSHVPEFYMLEFPTSDIII